MEAIINLALVGGDLEALDTCKFYGDLNFFL
jgi:hypothetical protein